MPRNRRLPSKLVTPALEDSGIFRNTVSRFSVELVPQFAQNARRDLIIKGFLDGETAIDVVFPGRRTALAEPLCDQLKSLWTRASATARYATQQIEVDSVRLPTSLEGAWRPRFQRDDLGWQTRAHQLYVARWSLLGADGTTQTFGAPVLRQDV